MRVIITHDCSHEGYPITKTLEDMTDQELGSVINFLIAEFVKRQSVNPLERAVDQNFQETNKLTVEDHLK